VPDPTVVVTDTSKWFGQKVAVSRVSCSFGPGLAGLLGPNGAGKTTLMRMIVGLLVPSEGTVTVMGEDVRAVPDTYRDIGLVPEEDAVYGFLTARQYVEYAARLSGVEDTAGAAARALSEVALESAADRALSGFSKGMRQRTKVAAALVNRPRLLVLDEPLNGTDPVQRAHLIEIFQSLGAAGHTVIVSSHVLAEVERMTGRVLAMVDGKLAAAGDIAAIRAAMSDIPFVVRVDAEPSRALGAALLETDFVRSIGIDGDTLTVETVDVRSLGTALPVLATRMGVRLTRVDPQDESLESVFRYLVRRR
jgi:ABC-2 type transport system ATP-binding protein